MHRFEQPTPGPIVLVELMAEPLPNWLPRFLLHELTDWRRLGAETAVQLAADGGAALASGKPAARFTRQAV